MIDGAKIVSPWMFHERTIDRRASSSKYTICCTGVALRPPSSGGQPGTSQPESNIRRCHRRAQSGRCALERGAIGAFLGRRCVGVEPGSELGPELLGVVVVVQPHRTLLTRRILAVPIEAGGPSRCGSGGPPGGPQCPHDRSDARGRGSVRGVQPGERRGNRPRPVPGLRGRPPPGPGPALRPRRGVRPRRRRDGRPRSPARLPHPRVRRGADGAARRRDVLVVAATRCRWAR